MHFPVFPSLDLNQGFPSGSDSKESVSNAGDPRWIPWSRGSPGEENGYPLQYSCLQYPKDREIWWATVHGISNSRTQLSNRHTQWFRPSECRKEMEMSICKCLASKCFLSHAVTMRCREEFYQTLLDSSLSTRLAYTLVIMVVLPSWNRPSNILQAARERSKILPYSSGP